MEGGKIIKMKANQDTGQCVDRITIELTFFVFHFCLSNLMFKCKNVFYIKVKYFWCSNYGKLPHIIANPAVLLNSLEFLLLNHA